jgi:hypothetical protein
MKDDDSSFLRRQADHCVALSRATFDLTIAARLRALAAELKSRADRADQRLHAFAAPSAVTQAPTA